MREGGRLVGSVPVMFPSHICRVRVTSPSSYSHLKKFGSSHDLVDSSHRNCLITSSHWFAGSSQCRVTRNLTFIRRLFCYEDTKWGPTTRKNGTQCILAVLIPSYSYMSFFMKAVSILLSLLHSQSFPQV